MSRHHVIFLGAGASFTSRYPVGNALRLRLSSRKRFESDFREGLELELDNRGPISGQLNEQVNKLCQTYFEYHKHRIDLFRRGGFGTVDEFSKLVTSVSLPESQKMKSMMLYAFGMYNPESTFEKSDYYPFIQRLFESEKLHLLRDDITILSYNYDTYFDYLLLEAQKCRLVVRGKKLDGDMCNVLNSGFWNTDSCDWNKTKSGFRYLKLHGSCTLEGGGDYSHEILFKKSPSERLDILLQSHILKSPPPIIFPWEIFDENGELLKDSVAFARNHGRNGCSDEDERMFNLYKTIWESANGALRKATKISFVGMSGHPYMMPGFKYLFGAIGKRDVQLVVANPENTNYRDFKNQFHRATLCGRIVEMLKESAPNMKCIKSFAEVGLSHSQTAMEGAHWDAGVTARYSFADFIQNEMD